jgi:hypothetical protein
MKGFVRTTSRKLTVNALPPGEESFAPVSFRSHLLFTLE